MTPTQTQDPPQILMQLKHKGYGVVKGTAVAGGLLAVST